MHVAVILPGMLSGLWWWTETYCCPGVCDMIDDCVSVCGGVHVIYCMSWGKGNT